MQWDLTEKRSLKVFRTSFFCQVMVSELSVISGRILAF